MFHTKNSINSESSKEIKENVRKIYKYTDILGYDKSRIKYYNKNLTKLSFVMFT